MISIKKGLNIPISGEPSQQISAGASVSQVAVIGPDYHGMKPTMAVSVGDKVAAGQVLFEDKKLPGVVYTSPAAGTISAINRGQRRMLESVVVDIDPDGESLSFGAHSETQLDSLDAEVVAEQLRASGQWVAFRTRPFSRVPAVGTTPNSIFVTAMDTNPLAADASLVIAENAEAFANGLKVISTLANNKVFVCVESGKDVSVPAISKVESKTFAGVHPAGNAGTHMHYVEPASLNRVQWSIGYQDVIAIGKLFVSGNLYSERVISLAGPKVKQPRLLRTLVGASLAQLTDNEIVDGDIRIISGSILNGRTAKDSYSFLGRYHTQVTALEEGRERPMLHYLQAGKNRFSALPIYLSSLMGKKKWDFTTTTNGSDRAMVPIGAYERIMPLDILPTQLLRALIVGDTQQAQKLGALELDEEDLALCTFVCPGKYEYASILRDNLTRIELEG